MDIYTVTLTFIEPLLGGVPKNPDLYRDYIASKAPDPQEANDEVLTVEQSMEKGSTGFHMDDGQPLLYDYLVKGYFKDACSMLTRAPNTESAKLKAFRKIIDGLVFVSPRRIYLHLPPNGCLSVLERPLRAQTAQGERVALARSDTAPVGTTITFDVKVLGGVPKALLVEWLDYGALRGLGGWRNASWGTFTYTLDAKA